MYAQEGSTSTGKIRYKAYLYLCCFYRFLSAQVHSSTRRIPPKQFCGDPDDLKARISTACPSQELPLAEVNKNTSTVRPSKQQSVREGKRVNKMSLYMVGWRIYEEALSVMAARKYCGVEVPITSGGGGVVPQQSALRGTHYVASD